MDRRKQLSFFRRERREHGGSLALGTRRSRRPLSTKTAIHVTLKSDLATGPRALLRHRKLIQEVARFGERRFGVKVYRFAICGNHLHFLIRGRTREGLQNFFRVFAGHIAQGILAKHPLSRAETERRASEQRGCTKNRRRFWSLLLYSRLVSWGREFGVVAGYIARNRLEALRLVADRERRRPLFETKTPARESRRFCSTEGKVPGS